MFDVHLIHIIGNGVKYYKSDRRLFDQLFPFLGEQSKARMFAELNRKAVSFDTAFQNRKIGGLPLIIIQNSEQSFSSQALSDSSGYVMDGDTRVELSHIFTSQAADINIYADSPEMVRCLNNIVQASILLFRKSLIKAQYEQVMYMGSSAIGVDPSLQDEGTSAYVRTMNYSALHHMIIPTRVEDLANIGATPETYSVEIIRPET